MEKIILTVDDECATLAILQTTLKKNYTIIKKNNGKEALEWLHEGNLPDAIVTDLTMPEMDGLALVKHLRASGLFRHIPVIMLSAHETSNTKIECLKSGADDYLIKPFNPQELELRINNLITRLQTV
jgi:two-component system, chemotaxis family, chemotaxis protein CheY